jgi:hypothetical protein
MAKSRLIKEAPAPARVTTDIKGLALWRKKAKNKIWVLIRIN